MNIWYCFEGQSTTPTFSSPRLILLNLLLARGVKLVDKLKAPLLKL